MTFRRRCLNSACLLLVATPLAANAAPTLWPDNGHYYETFVSDGIAWSAANSAATSIVNDGEVGMRCYLATLTSSTEHDFVDGLRSATPGINTSGNFENSELWIGGFQDPPTAVASANWKWVTGEAFAYTNWLPGEPNDAGTEGEEFMTIGWSNLSGWNDEAQLTGIWGYVKECQVDVDVNPDGPIDATSGVARNIDVLANDTIAPGTFTVTIHDSPAAPNMVTVKPDNTIDYLADTNFEGPDSFEYKVTHQSGAVGIAEVTLVVAAGKAVVSTGDNQPIFNQPPGSNNNNPLTAAYQQVVQSGTVEIDCCLVLDEREGAGRRGRYLPREFDLGLAIRRTDLNPTCVGMPELEEGQAVLRPWQRGVPESKGINRSNPAIAREHDLGVCVIEADVGSRGVVFSAEEASNVLGYSLNGRVKSLKYRPFTGGASISPSEVDNPYVLPWTAEWDESRSGKRYSTNVMVVNLWHEWLLMPSVPYLLQIAQGLRDSIESVELACPTANDDGFLDDLHARVGRAMVDILVAALPWRRQSSGRNAVEELEDVTRLALLIGPDAPPFGDPYEFCSVSDNPEGLIVGRSMALTHATCSELVQTFGDASVFEGVCKIPDDVLCELPALPGFPAPTCTP